jgi:hypothetical protein
MDWTWRLDGVIPLVVELAAATPRIALRDTFCRADRDCRMRGGAPSVKRETKSLSTRALAWPAERGVICGTPLAEETLVGVSTIESRNK